MYVCMCMSPQHKIKRQNAFIGPAVTLRDNLYQLKNPYVSNTRLCSLVQYSMNMTC